MASTCSSPVIAILGMSIAIEQFRGHLINTRILFLTTQHRDLAAPAARARAAAARWYWDSFDIWPIKACSILLRKHRPHRFFHHNKCMYLHMLTPRRCGGPGGKYETGKPDAVVELMYSSRDSTPKATRQTPGQTAEKEDHDPSGMARALLSEWAIRKVEGYEGANDVGVIHGFSLAKAILPIELKAGVLLRILAAAALPPLLSEKLRPSVANPSPYASHLSRPVIPGSGGNRRDPLVVSLAY
ncbi:hypothetical protein C8R47DRAFT_1228053 [Mycena vitilis]|nr:hypothetical protein C8R47DRAFT_1228053 [Mycena vitilis]